MSVPPQTLLVLSDIHYAAEAEKARGCAELSVIGNPLLRTCAKAYRHFIWRRDPFAHNYLLDRFIDAADGADCIIANGDYSCDTAFVGVSDDACYESARQCIAKLRHHFAPKLRLCLGDHELGKFSLFGQRGGLRLASWTRADRDLRLQPFWTLPLGNYLLVGVTSSLLAFPVFEPEALPEERQHWQALREAHLEQIRQTFSSLRPSQRVILFCHDPSALPFLWEDLTIRTQLPHLEATVIGHLHSNLILWKSRLLAGMPKITFLGNSVRRMSAALRQARLWRHFHVRLCPALAGIELTNRPAYLKVLLDPDAKRPLHFQICRLRRERPYRQ